MVATTAARTRDLDADRPESANYHANALARGLGLLERLAQSPTPLTLADLSRSTGLPKSTLVRLLAVLTELQYVVRVDEQPSFRLGHKVQGLARAYENSLDARYLAAEALRGLAAGTGHTANLGVLAGGEVVHVCVEEPDRPLRFHTAVGARDHAYCTGLGKVLLSGLDDAAVAARVPAEPFARFTPTTRTTVSELRGDLQRIRRRGFALDDGERAAGLRCMAIGIPVDGMIIAALSVSGPAAEFTPSTQRDYLALLESARDALAGDPDFATAITATVRALDNVA